MSVARRRWSDRELADAQWRAAGPDSAPLASADLERCRELISAALSGSSLEPLGIGALRARLGESLSTATLIELSLTMKRELGVVRSGHGPLFLVVGSDRHVPVESKDVVLVHTHIRDLPPSGVPGERSSGGDFGEARRNGPDVGAAVVGPDGRVTDYSAAGLSPDADWSYVSDEGWIDGRLHGVRSKPRRAWRARANTTALASSPKAIRADVLALRMLALGARGMLVVLDLGLGWLRGHFVSRSDWNRWVGERAVVHLAGLGPLWVKLGQLASSRPDLLPPEIVDALVKLRHQAGWRAASCELPGRIAQGLAEGTLASMDASPSYSGSVANIFKGTLPDGRTVAIKIMRPEASRRIELDLAILRLVGKIFRRLRWARDLPILELIAEIDLAVRSQCDLSREAQSTLAFRRNFDGVGGIVIPEVHESLSDGEALVLQYLEGLRSLAEADLPRLQSQAIARNLVRAMFRMIFDVGLVHIDMHPGNVLLCEDECIALVDFGLIAQLDLQEKRDFADLFFAMAVGDSGEVARVLYETALWRPAALDLEAFERSIEQVVRKHLGRRLGEFEVAVFVYDLMSRMRQHRLRSAVVFTQVLTALITFQGIALQLDPDLDFQREASVFIDAVRGRERARRVSRVGRRSAGISGVRRG